MKTAELRWMLLIFSLLGLLSAVFIPFPKKCGTMEQKII